MVDPMPRAEKLSDAYNNLYVEPLKEEQEFREFYVERPASAISPMEELKDRIEISDKKEKYLFLGFRGSGKSTELNRLESYLDKGRFIVVNYSIRDDLNMSDFDFRDFFVSMALKIYDIALAQGVSLNRDIENDFLDFTKRITSITEEELTRQRSAGIQFSRILTLKLSRESKTREFLRKELNQKISDLIQRLNWLIVDIEDKAKKQIVVIVDDLDKLTREEQSKDFFYSNYQLLLQPDCFVVYTFPIQLAFYPSYENVRQTFNGDMILLQLPVKDRHGNDNEESIGFYREVITKRMNPELIDGGVLDEPSSLQENYLNL